MRVIRNIAFLSAVSAATLSLTACETMKKAGDAITGIDVPFYGDDDVKAQDGLVMAQANGCPQVAVVEDLKSLTQFEVPSAPTPGEKISTVAITGIDTKCTVTENTVAADLTLRFDGALGPQAIEWNSQSRSFAYPYFIAVTTPTGEILSKEVFAATIRYDEGETAITQQEKTRQVIPLRDDTKPGQYEILIGFQLTEDELNYARMMAAAPAADTTSEAAATTDYDMTPTAKATPVYPEVKAAPAAKVTAEAVPTPQPAAAATTATPAPVTTPTTTPATTAETTTETIPATATVTTTTTQAPAPLPTVSAPTPTPMPTTTDDSMKAAPTSKEMVEESSKAVSETVTPAAPPAAETATPAPVTPAMVDPYAPPPTQVIRIKPDGTIEKK